MEGILAIGLFLFAWLVWGIYETHIQHSRQSMTGNQSEP
jgi:hypothetical protein